ncbi:MAG TPA: hypothetical protein VGJ05_22035, partial [Fimbriiglobus sp.]
MTRYVVACVFVLFPVLSAAADDPKPDVQKLKDKVELLAAKLDVWKAKVTGAEKMAVATKDVLNKLNEAARAGAAAFSESAKVIQSNLKATTDVDVFQAEMRVAEVTLNQAKRRLATAEKGAEAPAKKEKTYAVSFVNQPWNVVFDWFA